MNFLDSNLYDFVEICFWHYCIALGAALVWFLVSGKRQNRLLTAFVIGFLATFALRMIVHLDSSRYLLTPVLLSFPIIAFAGVALFDRCRKIRFGLWLFVLLAVIGMSCSFMKNIRKGDNPRDQVVLQGAKIIKADFAASGRREALLVSNADNIGMIFAYADIPGKFYTLDFVPDEPKKFETQLHLLCSQYPLVYLLKEQRNRKHEKWNNACIFSVGLNLPHSYRQERIDGGALDPRQWYGRFELFRIESKCGESRDEREISKFVDAPPAGLPNGDFSQWAEKRRINIDKSLDNRFLNEQPEQRLPTGWGVDCGNRRGRDFTQWRFEGLPVDGRMRFDAPDGGFALKSAQPIPVGDCRVALAGTFSPGCKVLVFLYVYDRKHSFLLHQNAGVWQSGKGGRALVSIPIRRDSFPAEAAFFGIGVIGWQGNFSIEKMDVSVRGTGSSNE